MDFEYLAVLIKEEDIPIVARAACMQRYEMKVIMLYRAHLLVKRLWYNYRDNDELTDFGRHIYFQLMEAVNDLMEKCKRIGYNGLGTFDLDIFNDHN